MTVFVLYDFLNTIGDTQIVLINDSLTDVETKSNVWNSGFYEFNGTDPISRIKIERLERKVRGPPPVFETSWSANHYNIDEVKIYQTKNLLQFAEVAYQTVATSDDLTAENLINNLASRSFSRYRNPKLDPLDDPTLYQDYNSCYVAD